MGTRVSGFEGVFTRVPGSIPSLPLEDLDYRVRPEFAVDAQKAVRLQRSKWVGKSVIEMTERLSIDGFTDFTRFISRKLEGREPTVSYAYDEYGSEMTIHYLMAHNRDSAIGFAEDVAWLAQGALDMYGLKDVDYDVLEYIPSQDFRVYLKEHLPKKGDVVDFEP